jgi:hypothetical protein
MCVDGPARRRLPNVLSLSRSRPPVSHRATRSVARSEARKRRANERPRVGCCEELAGSRHKRLCLREPAVQVRSDAAPRAVRQLQPPFLGLVCR